MIYTNDHKSLNITGHADKETYVCTKLLWDIRQLLTEQQLSALLFVAVTGELIH
jgi:hypothetical protein